MKFAATSGYWPLYRFDPTKTLYDENPFQLDQKALTMSMSKFTGLENRFKTLQRSLPDVAESLATELQEWALRRHDTMKWRESRGKESATDGTQVGEHDTNSTNWRQEFSRKLYQKNQNGL